MLVSKAGVAGAADKALLKQLSGYPKALGMSEAVMLFMALLPGIPVIPFLALGTGASALAFIIDKRTKLTAAVEAKKTETAAKADAADEPIASALEMDDLKVELGYALLPLVNAPDGSDRLTEQIRALRRSLAVELGFVMPAVRSLDNVQLDANSYVIKVKEVEAGSGKVWSGQYMVLDPGRRAGEIARHAHHRANFRTPGNMDRRRAQRGSVDKGYTVVDAATVLSTHLTELLKNNMAELLSYGEVQKLQKELQRAGRFG